MCCSLRADCPSNLYAYKYNVSIMIQCTYVWCSNVPNYFWQFFRQFIFCPFNASNYLVDAGCISLRNCNKIKSIHASFVYKLNRLELTRKWQSILQNLCHHIRLITGRGYQLCKELFMNGNWLYFSWSQFYYYQY